jgi:hypothetical protein
VLQQKRAERADWLTRLQRGEATSEQDPHPLGPIVRTSTAFKSDFTTFPCTRELPTEFIAAWSDLAIWPH